MESVDLEEFHADVEWGLWWESLTEDQKQSVAVVVDEWRREREDGRGD